MLVHRYVYDFAVYGGLVAFVASAWVAVRHRERWIEPKVPIATTGRAMRRYIARITPVFILIAVLGGEWELLSHAHDAVVVEPGPSAWRGIYLGSGLDANVSGIGDTLVINRSEHELKFLRVEYGDYEVLANVAPGETTKVHRVDFIGPAAPASDPNDLESQRRTWLTWD